MIKKRTVIAAIILIISSFAFGYFLKFPNTIHQLKVPIQQKLTDIYLAYWLKKSGFVIKNVYLDIKFKDLQRLKFEKEKALSVLAYGKEPVLFSSDKNRVPAMVTYDHKSERAKVRLKGDLKDNYNTDKLSFRVHLNKQINGLSRFSLHSTDVRHYVNEWLFHQILKEKNKLALRYEFVQLYLNGKKMGLYAIEQHFSKNLVESNQYREGPILKLNEDIFWFDSVYKGRLISHSSIHSRYTSMRSFEAKQVAKSPQQYNAFLKGRSLFNGFRRHSLQTTQVFDAEKLANFITVSHLLCAPHAFAWTGFRFYYNPITTLLEPIGFDANAGEAEFQLMSRVASFSQDRLFFNQLASTITQSATEGLFLDIVSICTKENLNVAQLMSLPSPFLNWPLIKHRIAKASINKLEYPKQSQKQRVK